jgi:hypothetical protein
LTPARYADRTLRKTKTMSVSSIGVQVIMPKTGTSWDSAPQQQANDREAANKPAAKEAPPPPGMGKYVDKTA